MGTVRLVREDPPEAEEPVREPLRLIPPPPVQIEPPAPVGREVRVVEAVGVLTALAAVLSVRLVLLLTALGAVGLTVYAIGQHSVLAVVSSALFDLFALIPVIGLSYRKG